MTRSSIGWLFVAAQLLLLVALVVVPSADDWERPLWLWGVVAVLGLGGAAVMAIAALGLGRALTPTPVPVEGGELVTDGLYRWVRHPIYSGVLLIVLALVVRSANWVTVVLGAATFGFFHAKARWEEQQLAETYAAYATYAADTGRFVPRFGR